MTAARATGEVRPEEGAGGGKPSEREALWFWLKLGCISFGGPAGQIAIMHEELVERRKWISERRFLHALNFCMALPGPEAQQLASYIGYSLYGVRGAITSGGLFVAPSFVRALCDERHLRRVRQRHRGRRRRQRPRRRRRRPGGRRGAPRRQAASSTLAAAIGLAVAAFAAIVAGVPFPIIIADRRRDRLPGRSLQPRLARSADQPRRRRDDDDRGG